MNSVAKQLVQAAIDLSARKGKGSRKKGQFGKSTKIDMIDWSHDDIGSIQIELKGGLKFGETLHQKGPNTWRKIDLGSSKPSSITLDFNYKLNEGVELIYALGNRVINMHHEDPKPFVVSIEWQDGPKDDADPIPVLSHGDDEDFQLYAVNTKTGFVVHLDISVVSRCGHFSVTIQDVTGAQAVWHATDLNLTGYTSIQIGDRAYSLVPVYAENCYDGFDPVASWNRSYGGRADKVLGYIAEFGAAVPAEESAPGEWQPEWLPHVPAHLKGYHVAVALWYNLTMGQGFVQLKDGMKCFVHFKVILDEEGKGVAQQGDFPVLEPMKGCYVKYIQEKGKSNPRATAVRLY